YAPGSGTPRGGNLMRWGYICTGTFILSVVLLVPTVIWFQKMAALRSFQAAREWLQVGMTEGEAYTLFKDTANESWLTVGGPDAGVRSWNWKADEQRYSGVIVRF